MRHYRFSFLLALLAFWSPQPAEASFHFVRISEIFTGVEGNPAAQYVVLVAYANSQNLFSGVQVTVFDATGNPLPDFATFAANLPSSTTNQRSILVATPAYLSHYMPGVSPDQSATGALPQSGMICFKRGPTVVDCVSYGAYTGSPIAGGSSAGPPAEAPTSGNAIRRDFGANTTLEAADDTNDSAANFDGAPPVSENFAGSSLPEQLVSPSGGVTLSWTATDFGYSIHKTNAPSTVRGSAAVAALGATNWIDPNPTQFPGLSCYVVKP